VTRSVISAEASVTRDIDQISSLAGTRMTRDCRIDQNATVIQLIIPDKRGLRPCLIAIISWIVGRIVARL
jgi:hypothetical protein